MSDRAVITLQVGNYANYVGTHLWNLQEAGFVFEPDEKEAKNNDIDNDVLFREGLTLSGEVTFTPRLVCVDLKGSLGLLPQLGDLYDSVKTPKTDNLLWDGQTEVSKEEPRKKNDLQRELEAENSEEKDICEGDDRDYDLDDQVQFWSDYLNTRFHPRSTVILKEYQQGNKLKPFDVYGLGETAWREEDAGEQIEDAVRYFAEEADSLQGFQVLCDPADASGGLNSCLLDHVSDAYPGKCALAFPVSDCYYPDKSPAANSARFLNYVLSLRAMAVSSTLTTPLSLSRDAFYLPGNHRPVEGVSYKPELAYHSAAVLASALDIASLPWRRKKGSHSVRMFDLAGSLGARGRNLASVSVCLPLRPGPGQAVSQFLQGDRPFRPVSLLPLADKSQADRVSLQAVSVRGLSQTDLHPERRARDDSNPYYGCNNIQEAFETHFLLCQPRVPSGVSIYDSGLPIKKPFPKILTEKEPPAEKVSAMTLWQSSSAGGELCRSVADRASRISLGRMHRFGEAGLEDDEFREVVEDLNTVADAYQDN